MWQYNYSKDNDYLMHKDHKYLDRYKGKSGKWVYVYNKAKQKVASMKPTVEKGGWNDGERDRQDWENLEFKNGMNVGTVKGSNSSDKYAGISVGKVKDDYNYVEKSKKIGGVEVVYDNEYGMHNVTVHVDHETIEKGKSKVKKLLGIN